jgi:hypothetical protein
VVILLKNLYLLAPYCKPKHSASARFTNIENLYPQRYISFGTSFPKPGVYNV